MKKAILILLPFIFLIAKAGALDPSIGDLNDDKIVNIEDMAIFAQQWLDPPGGTADLVGVNGVNLSDYAVFSQNWLYVPLIISEFMARNYHFFADGTGAYPDWIEIYNPLPGSVSLQDWYLTDDPNDLHKWPFPGTASIAGGGYLLVFASEKAAYYSSPDPGGYFHTNFKLDGGGEYLALVHGNKVIHAYTPEYPDQTDNVSFGLGLKSTGTTTLISSPYPAQYLVPLDGSLELTWTEADFDDSSWNSGYSGIGYETAPENYYNLINATVPVYIPTFYSRFHFPVENSSEITHLIVRVRYDDAFVAYLNGTEVARSEYAPDPALWNSPALNCPLDSSAFVEYDISAHIPQLQSDSDNVLAIHTLNCNYTASTDMLILPELAATLQTEYDTDVPMFFAGPTPEVKNSGGTPYIVAPHFSRSCCLFTENFNLELMADSPSAVIYYTLNGSDPTFSSPVYSGPIAITAGTLVKAAVYEPGVGWSKVAAQGYSRLDPATQAFTSDIPIVVMDTFGNEMDVNERTVYMLASAVFIDVDPITGRADITDVPDYSGLGGIRVRGQSSALMPKKGYKFETWNKVSEEKNVSLLGMPAESDWAFFGPIFDKTLMRAILAFQWSNEIGRYAPRTRYCEMFLNTNGGNVALGDLGDVNPDSPYDYPGDYVGFYVLMEKIKSGPNRVDIAKLEPEDAAEPEITGGYILQSDWNNTFSTSYADFEYVEPDAAQITSAQITWIQNYLNEFGNVLYGSNFADPVNGYSKYIDIPSYIDLDILMEFYKNNDGNMFSTHLHKDRSGKLTMGPAWDQDQIFGLFSFCNLSLPSIWYKDERGDSWPHMRAYHRLYQDPEFYLAWWDRWCQLRRHEFRVSQLQADTDTMAAKLAEAQVRNFQRWPVMGKIICTFQGTCIANAFPTYQQEVDYLKNWMTARSAWMDSQCPYPWPPAFTHKGGHIPVGTNLGIASGGVLGGSLNMDGSGDYVEITGYQGIVGTNSRTVTAWINTTQDGTIISWGSTNPAGGKWMFVAQNATDLKKAIRVGIWGGYIVGSTDIFDGNWHHVAAVLENDGTPDVSEVKLYVDGVQEEISSFVSCPLNTVAGINVTIGLIDEVDKYFNGCMDDVRIYNRALTDTEIAALANLETSPTAGLVGHWKLDESSGTTAADSVAGHPGTIVGNPVWQSAKTIYYTLDGSDPRQRGGAISPAAFNYSVAGPPVLEENARIQARTFASGKWSTLLAADFLIDRGVVINEFMALNKITIEDPDEPGEYPDWIELYNHGTEVVDLGGMYLTDDLNEPTKWQIADGLALNPGDYLLFWADDDGTQGPYHTNFKLDQYEETVALFAADGVTLIDFVVFGDQKRDISYGRYPDGAENWGFMESATPGMSNNPHSM